MNITIKELYKKYVYSLLYRILILLFFLVLLLIFCFYKKTIDLLIIIMFSFFIYFMIYNIVSIIKGKKYLESMSVQKVNILNRELNDIILKRCDCILTDNYLFMFSYDFKIISYDEIERVYYKKNLTSHSIEKELCVIDKNKNRYVFIIDSTSLIDYEDIKDFCNILIEKNANIILGKK